MEHCHLIDVSPNVSVHRHAGVKIITNHHDIKQDHSLDCEIYSRSNHLYFEFTPTCLWTLRLGYQLGFVRLFNQFPAQVTFEPIEDLVAYMSLQLDIAPVLIEQYKKRQQTIAEHRKLIQEYLSLKPFHPDGVELLSDFLYKEALQIEPTDSLLVKATHFLRDNHILNPAEATLRRTIYEQRKKTRKGTAPISTYMYAKE